MKSIFGYSRRVCSAFILIVVLGFSAVILPMIDSASDSESHLIAWAPFVLAGEGGARR